MPGTIAKCGPFVRKKDVRIICFLSLVDRNYILGPLSCDCDIDGRLVEEVPGQAAAVPIK